MKINDRGPHGFEELLGAWRKHVEARSAAGSDGASARRQTGDDDWGDWGDLGEWFGDDSRAKKRIAEMEEQMDLMAKAITMLLDRVTVLEKLAVHDEARLAEEIEKLRR